MKVLYVFNDASEFACKFYVNEFRELQKLGWQIDLACNYDQEVPYITTSYPMPWNRNPFKLSTFQGIKKVRKLIETNGYDIVYCSSPIGGLIGRLAVKKVRDYHPGVIYFCHGFHFCVDGDGSFIMHMGSFPVIADKAPKNFKYIMINNGAHESVGGQPTVALKINAPEILRGAGFKKVIEAKNEEDIRAGIAEQEKNPLVAMIIYCHQGSRDNLGRPTTTPIQNKQAFMKAIKD